MYVIAGLCVVLRVRMPRLDRIILGDVVVAISWMAANIAMTWHHKCYMLEATQSGGISSERFAIMYMEYNI